MIPRINSSQPDFAERIKALRESQAENLSQVDGAVAEIIADVRDEFFKVMGSMSQQYLN